MLTDITIGQFFPGKSLPYRLDPRMKIVLTVFFLVMIFIPQNWVGLATVIGFLVFLLVLSRLPVSLLWRSVKPILPVILLTAVLNIFYVTGGTPLWDWKFIHITTKGIATAGFIAIRIIALIMGSSLLTYTTTPTALTDGIEYLLRPLKAVRINAHELAMMMTIALRFIPTLMEETDKIMAAQKARGADLESGGLLQRAKALIPILIPLFVSAFRRAYELALALECRCYQGGEGRTRMKQLRTAPKDWLALALFLLFTALSVVINRVFPAVI